MNSRADDVEAIRQESYGRIGSTLGGDVVFIRSVRAAGYARECELEEDMRREGRRVYTGQVLAVKGCE